MKKIILILGLAACHPADNTPERPFIITGKYFDKPENPKIVTYYYNNYWNFQDSAHFYSLGDTVK